MFSFHQIKTKLEKRHLAIHKPSTLRIVRSSHAYHQKEHQLSLAIRELQLILVLTGIGSISSSHASVLATVQYKLCQSSNQ